MSETKSGKSSLIPLLSRHSAQPADSERGTRLLVEHTAAYCRNCYILLMEGTTTHISYILLHLLLILQSYMCKSGLNTQVGSHIPIDLDKDMCAKYTVHVSAVMTCF